MENKSSEPNLKLNLFLNFVVQFIGYLVPLLLAPYLSRTLGAKGIGDYSYAFSIVSYFSLIISFGFINYGTKEIAENRNNKEKLSQTIWNVFWGRFIIFILAIALYLIAINESVITAGIDRSVFIILIIVLFGNLVDITFVFQGLEKIKTFSIINVVINCIYMIFVFIFVHDIQDLLIYTFLKSMVSLITGLISIWIMKNIIGSAKFCMSGVRLVLVSSLFFFIPALITKITPIIDMTMLGALSSTTQVGYYEQANKIKNLVASIIYAFTPIIMSRVSYLNTENKTHEAKEKTNKIIEVSFLVLVPAIIGLYLISDLLFPTYFGSEFQISAKIMYFLAPSIVFSSLASLLLNGVFYSTGQVKKATHLLLICDSINLMTNYFAICYLDACGAALTSSLSNGLLCVLCFYFSKQFIDIQRIIKYFIRVVIYSIPMLFIIIAFRKYSILLSLNNIEVIMISVILGGVSYFLSILLFMDKYCAMILDLYTRRFKS